MPKHVRHMFVIATFFGLACGSYLDTRLDNAAAAIEPHSSLATIGTFATSKEGHGRGVTILGVTKGVSFLDSQQLVYEAGRKHGSNAVPWMRVAAFIENHGDTSLGFQVETDDGREFVGKVKVRSGDRLVAKQSHASKQMDLDFAGLGSAIFPVAPPTAEEPKAATVFVFTLSGDFQKAETATLQFQFGRGTGQQEITFKNVPIP